MEPINVNKWIQESKSFFLPPVCNKLMHNNQLKVMFVGGPNQRKDYHIEEGEEQRVLNILKGAYRRSLVISLALIPAKVHVFVELFYQLEGDMCLKIIENGEHKDIHIKEGEMFLLPARIPHSPQRFPHTVGLVFERMRYATEKDGLRYYVDNSTEVLFEKWFYCEDLVIQLGPVIAEFFNSKQYKTGKPDPDQISEKMPFPLNTQKVMEPFAFQSWLDERRLEIDQRKYVSLFEGLHETQAAVYGTGESEEIKSDIDTWLWQLEGSSFVTVDDEKVTLTTGDSLLIPPQSQFSWKREAGCIAFCIHQDPAKRKGYN